MKRVIIAILLIAVVMLGVRTCVITSCVIPSSGMENTLFAGDCVLVNRWSYGYRVPLMSLFGYHRWGRGKVKHNDILLFNNPMADKQKTIDSCDLYVGCCSGVPGDTLMLNEELQLTNEKVVNPDSKQFYYYPDKCEDQVHNLLQKIGIKDNELFGYNGNNYIRNLSHYELYLLRKGLGKTVVFTCLRKDTGAGIHPYVIPSKGKPIKVYPWNAKLLCNTLVKHENRKAEVRRDTLLIDGKPVQWCFFSQDYYWVSSNNPIGLCDSRLFGFVPSTHLIGRAVMVCFSKGPHTSFFRGYRWNRFFQFIQ